MRYIAFFRGINVGGKNIVKMADLKQLFLSLGFLDVKTYIQSGNVIFSSAENEGSLVSLISKAFESQFGFNSVPIIRSGEELAKIINTHPFTAEEIDSAQNKTPDVEHEYVYLSNKPINADKINKLFEGLVGEDKIYIEGRELYFLCAQGIRDSKLAAKLAKYQHPMTSRNFKTMNKIINII